ncbi:hypothetical protein [Endozoicomonas lisbonensis]|uniref:Uncharacterized protein n=1 Tax=Endozoicomonas lisbonensis TaxID=3120522 RepID=A0ABV2SPD2_9GAMM
MTTSIVDQRIELIIDVYIERWQRGELGFMSALFDLMKMADAPELEKIRRGYPHHVAAFLRWQSG